MRQAVLLSALFMSMGLNAQNTFTIDADFVKAKNNFSLVPEVFQGKGVAALCYDGSLESKSAPVIIDVLDLATGKLTDGDYTDLDPSRKGAWAYEGMAQCGDVLFLVSNQHLEKENTFVLYATPVDAGTFKPKSAAIEFGRIPYTGGVTAGQHKLALQIVLSPDRKRALVLFDGAKSESTKKQMVHAFVLDATLKAAWSKAFEFPSAFRETFDVDVAIDETGGAFVLMCPHERKKAVVDGVGQYTVELYKLTSEGMAHVTVVFPGDAVGVTSLLALEPEGNIACVGFCTGADAGADVTTGVFRARFAADLKPIGQTQVTEFNAPTKGTARFIRWHRKSDGGYYLLGEPGRMNGDFCDEADLQVVSVSKDMKLEWHTTVARDMRSIGWGRTFNSSMQKDHLLIAFSDLEKNLAPRQQEEKLKAQYYRDCTTMLATFSPVGVAKYQLLKKGAWTFDWAGELPDGTVIGTGTKPVGDKGDQANGYIILRLKEGTP